MELTLNDHLLAARMVAAAASEDPLQLRIVMDDIRHNENAGGILPVLLVLSDDVIKLARALEPDGYRESIRRAVADLTRRIDAQPPEQPR